MTPKERAAMQQALDYLENSHARFYEEREKAIIAMREALDPELQFVRDWNEGKVRRVFDGKVMGVAEQEEQEPVAWKDKTYGNLHHQDFGNSIPLYAAPVRTKDMTDDDIYKLADDVDWAAGAYLGFARAVIAADREKNK